MNISDYIYTAAILLKNGQLVAIPTETVYGLAANALDETAVLKIFEAKQRPYFDPLIVHIPGLLAVDKYAEAIPQVAWDLAESFWPGPLTLVLPKKDIISDLVTAGQPTVGLRMPSHAITLALLNYIDFPLAAPSANPFGYISPTSAKHVSKQLGSKVAFILDGGNCRVGVESTIIGFENNIPSIYRLGGIPIEEIQKITGPIDVQLNESSNPPSPGQLSMHYAPTKPFFLGNIDVLKETYKDKSVGIIRFVPKGDEQWALSIDGNLFEAASNLFKILRLADACNCDIIIAEPVPDTGIGRAVNDRLQRASARKSS